MKQRPAVRGTNAGAPPPPPPPPPSPHPCPYPCPCLCPCPCPCLCPCPCTCQSPLQVTPAGPGHKGGAPEALPGVLLQWLGRETDPTALASLLSTVLSLSALRSVAVQLPAFAPPLLLNSKLDGTAFLREAALRIAARAVRLQPDCLALSDAKLNRRVAVVLGSSTPLAKAAGVAMFGALVSRPDLRDRNVAKLIASGAAKALLKILQVDHVAEDCPNLQPYAVALDALAGTEDGLTLLIGAECDVVLKLEQMLQVPLPCFGGGLCGRRRPLFRLTCARLRLVGGSTGPRQRRLAVVQRRLVVNRRPSAGNRRQFQTGRRAAEVQASRHQGQPRPLGALGGKAWHGHGGWCARAQGRRRGERCSCGARGAPCGAPCDAQFDAECSPCDSC